MHSILLRYTPSDYESLSTELWQQGTLGIIEEPTGLRAFFDETDQFPNILAHLAGRTIETRIELPPDPSDFPKQDWEPILVGTRFCIAPSWVDTPIPNDRIRLTIDNPNAFGTGRHESTQLVLQALERYVRDSSTVLDIGSGSGILTSAALLLGAPKVVACDIHADSISSSKPYLDSRLFLGSADAIRSATGDVVLANISAKVIDLLSWDLNRIAKPDGILILSGFIYDHLPTRFSPVAVTQLGDWLCWVCRPRDVSLEKSPAVLHDHSLQWW